MSAFTFDASELRACSQFTTSSLELERDCFTTELATPLDAYAETYGPDQEVYRVYEKARPFFNDKDGLTHNHAYLSHLERQGRAAHDAFEKALCQLDNSLIDEAIYCIKEALELVGVTDPATVFEVCRCIIKGGEMWDGKGFTPGEVPACITPANAPPPSPASSPAAKETAIGGPEN